MRELLNAFSLMSIRQVVSVLYGLVRSKLLAALLGPFGMGIVSQGTVLMRMLQQFTALGIGSGFVKLATEYRIKGRSERLNRTISMVLGAFGLLGLLMVWLAHLVAEQAAELVFGDSQYRWFVVIIAMASLLYVEYNFILRIFQSMLRWRDYVRVSVIGYTLSIFVTAALIVRGGIMGAVFSIMATQAISLAVAIWVLHRHVVEVEDLHYWRFLPDRQAALDVGRFIGPLTLVAAFSMSALVIVRTMIVGSLGIEANGLYQVVWGISVTYMGLLLVSLNSFGVPKVSSHLGDREEITKIQNHELRLGLFVVIPIVITLSSLRDWWIPILYSSSFLGAGSIMVWHFGGDVFRVMRQSFNINLVPYERFGFIVVDALVYWGGWAGGVWVLLPRLGLAAVPLAYFAAGALATTVSYGYQHSRLSFRLTPRNRILVLKMALVGAVGLVSTHLIGNTWLRLGAGAVVLGAMAIWVPTKQEYTDLIALAKEHLSNIKPSGNGSSE